MGRTTATKRKHLGDYACSPACGQSFDTCRGLGRQFHCKAYGASLTSTLTEAVAAREYAKRTRLDIMMDLNAIDGHGDSGREHHESNGVVASTTVTSMSTTIFAGDLMASSEQSLEPSPTIHLDTVLSIQQPDALALTQDTTEGELGRGKRKKVAVQRYVAEHTKRRKAVKYRDPKPDPPAPIPDTENQEHSVLGVPRTNISIPPICQTEKNFYGFFRQYFRKPSFVPDETGVSSTIDAVEPSVRGPITNESNESSTLGEVDGAQPIIHTLNDSSSSNMPPAQPTDDDDSLKQQGELHDWFWPFLSATAFRLMNWFWVGSQQKSIADLQTLVDDVLTADDFRFDDLQKFSVKRESQRLDSFQEKALALGISDIQDGWKVTSVSIHLPDRCARESAEESPSFTVTGLYYRSITQVIKAAFTSPDALRYHYMPFKQLWSSSSTQPSSLLPENIGDQDAEAMHGIPHPTMPEVSTQRIYDELYSSDTWYDEHSKIEAHHQPDDPYEIAIAALMLWSDSTHLTDFGNASLWPIYLYFGNQSKYERCRPNAHACHHIAYLPELPDSISEAFRKQGAEGKKPSSEALTHCKRDLLQALLAKIFDEEFTDAYREGLIIKCTDGITRRIFPRIFTWSADYPEKVMLATIRYLSDCPCPRCLVPRTEAHKVGTKQNDRAIDTLARKDSEYRQSVVQTAREKIYHLGRGVKSAVVAALLFAQSMVPTINTLSTLLHLFGGNFYSLFVVDLMHEFELGVWKTTFVQLIQIVSDGVPDGLSKLNERYRSIPTFGGDTIRKFSADASSMAKLGARDFEDLLLCSIPAFEGLLPAEHNEVVLDLLFCLATWHALAKLRMHTDSTVSLLDNATSLLGEKLRLFKAKTCEAFETEELKHARIAAEKLRATRKKGKANLKRTTTSRRANALNKGGKKKSKKAKKHKVFNLNNFKTHSLGHYTRDIRTFGSVDSYSTQSGELEHRQVKKYYSRTNRNNATWQMTLLERRDYIVRRIAKQDPYLVPVEAPDVEAVPFIRSDQHHHISISRNNYVYIPAWLRQHGDDPATNDFCNKLKDHLLRRLLDAEFDGDEEEYSEEQRNTVQIEYNRLYIHKVLRVNYTTYDLRRSQDSMNPRTHSDIMVLAPKIVRKGSNPEDLDENYEDEGHPFWYARIVSVFHANIRHVGPKSKTGGVPTKMEFLLVRWYGQASEMPSGWSVKRLHAIKFVPKWDAGAFGFIDPSQVVRGAHLIPAFHHGKALARLTNSIACKSDEDEWECYYVNSFVDRDMFMRYAGGGVGHTQIELATKLQALTSKDLQPEQDTAYGEIPATSNRTTMPYSAEDMATMCVDEELDEVLSDRDDYEDSSASEAEN